MLRVNNLAGFGGGRRVHTLTFVDSAVSNAATITIPATAQAGDLAVLIDHAYESLSTTADVIPTDWTGWTGSDKSLDAGADDYIARMSYKILVSGDPNTAITGLDENSEQKVMLVFRGNQPITSVVASTASAELTDANPTSQTVSAAGKASPLVVIGAAAGHLITAAFSTASPAFDGTATTADSDAIMGYKIYNSSPADHTIDMNDLGDGNYLASGYLSVS